MCRGGPAVARGGVPGRRGAPGGGAVPGAAGGGFSPGGGAKNFFQKGPTRMYKEAVDPVWARLVDKAMFLAILWWV